MSHQLAPSTAGPTPVSGAASARGRRPKGSERSMDTNTGEHEPAALDMTYNTTLSTNIPICHLLAVANDHVANNDCFIAVTCDPRNNHGTSRGTSCTHTDTSTRASTRINKFSSRPALFGSASAGGTRSVGHTTGTLQVKYAGSQNKLPKDLGVAFAW
eukprot:scaffold593030_cov33-Prasinocladus_malaysianus.AAC.1